MDNLEQGDIDVYTDVYGRDYLGGEEGVKDAIDAMNEYETYMEAVAKGECGECAINERGYCDDCISGGSTTKIAL